MDKFNFISDELFRKNFESDFTELEKGISSKSNKSVLIMAGSIIEAILIDYLISLELPDLRKQKLLKWDLNEAITKCFELKIISEKSKNLSHVVKNYRNLIHPGKAIRTKSFPDENDAIVAKSLVEIIIKEISEKKQESYGFTAEQILQKIVSDSTSEVIWHHLIKKLNNYEKKRLLLKAIPERYFQIYNDIRSTFTYPEIEIKNLSNFFKLVYDSSEDDLKKDIANRFVEVLLEGSSFEVIHNLESFFITDYFEHYTPENKQLVKDHLLGSINEVFNHKIAVSLRGISKYLTQEEFEKNVSVLFKKVVYSTEKEEIDSAKNLLDHEYENTDGSNQKYILKLIDDELETSGYYSEALTECLQSLRDFLTVPF